MFISTLLTDNFPKSKIFKDIDRKIAQVAEDTLNEIRYKTQNCSTIDVEILSDLRSILLAVQNNAECFKDYSEEEILSIIKQYIY